MKWPNSTVETIYNFFEYGSIINFLCGVVTTWLGLILFNKQKKKNYNAMLIHAKREVQDIAQIALNNPYPQIEISKDGKIIFINSAAIKEFPTIQEETVAHPILRQISTQISENNNSNYEVTYNKKFYSLTIIKTETILNNGGFIVYCYDITERKKYETQLKSALAYAEESKFVAEQAKEARGNFLANMSHELRTPMNGIIGLSEILLEENLKLTTKDMARAINSSAKNLLALVNDILDFSKIEAGELKFETIAFNAADIIKQLEFLHSPIAQQKQLFFHTHINSNIPEYLLGDPSRLQQIINNLIGNALKFTNEGKVLLTLEGHMNNEHEFVLKIIVQDTGIGISKEKQALIFDKFQQADISTTRQYGGTGLGLTITKQLTDMMNGTISIESQLNIGTTFTVMIPFKISKEIPTKDCSSLNSRTLMQFNTDLKILIVDDHPVNLLYLKTKLKSLGFSLPAEAENGRKALELFQQNHFDLIFMDCQMPEMDGFTTTRAIRKHEASYNIKPTTIIAVTANAMKGVEEDCCESGMDGYISKPIDSKQLLDKLQRHFPETNELEYNQASKKNSYPVIFNWQNLNNATDGDPRLNQNIIAIFIEHLDNDMQALNDAYDKNDFKAWDEWAHKIYGACANIGAEYLAKICDEAQSLSTSLTDQPRIHMLQKEIEKAYSILKYEIMEFQGI